MVTFFSLQMAAELTCPVQQVFGLHDPKQWCARYAGGEMKRSLCWVVICVALFSGPGVEARQPWLILRESGIEIYCREPDLRHAEEVMPAVLESARRIMEQTGKSLPDTVRIVIAHTPEEFDRLTGGSIPGWGAGAARPVQNLIIVKSPRFSKSRKRQEVILAHELSHILLSHISGKRVIKRWFDEGLAQYLSGEKAGGSIVSIARAAVTGSFIHLDDIEYVLTFQQVRATLAYAESRAAIDYIIREYGPGAVRGILDHVSRQDGLENALMAELGVDEAGFERLLFLDLKKRYRWAIVLDTRILVSLVMVVLFIGAYINVLRKKREYNEDDEIETGYEDTPWD